MSSQPSNSHSRSVLLSFRFAGTALVGSLTMALVGTFAPLPAQIAVLGACVSILAGLFVAYVEQEEARERRRVEMLERLRVPLALAPEHDLFDRYVTITEALVELARRTDPVLREVAQLKLATLSAEVRSLAQGTIVFSATETWRTVYERLLESPGLRTYRSVAWVKTRDYWQDQPGRQSMRTNYFMANQGLKIDRILILRDDLWSAGQFLPLRSIRPWLDEQNDNGIWLMIVRESEISAEPDLLADFGIYGDRATGTQELDDQSRTQRFILRFEPQDIKLASDRWERLSLYAVSYKELLDREPDDPYHTDQS